jgi:hypothetical protein
MNLSSSITGPLSVRDTVGVADESSTLALGDVVSAPLAIAADRVAMLARSLDGRLRFALFGNVLLPFAATAGRCLFATRRHPI